LNGDILIWNVENSKGSTLELKKDENGNLTLIRSNFLYREN